MIFTIVKLATLANKLEIYISIGAQIFIHAILFFSIPKLVNLETYFLQIVPLLQ